MIGSVQVSPWIKKKALLIAGSVTATVVAAALVVSSGEPTRVHNGIPLPFGSQTSSLTGRVSFMGERNGIDIYEVTYTNAEVFEYFESDRIYLVHIPNVPGIIDAPLDEAMAATTGTGRSVNYYGYRYADAAATLERKDVTAPRFKDRFPGQFFASAKARAQDAAHGNQLTAFEQKNDIVFRPTDGSAGSVRMDPAGALYVFIVNEHSGARLFARSSGMCGNGVYEPGEECDDGDTNDENTCSNACKNNIPLPFDETTAGTGTKLAISVQTVATSGTVQAGQTGVTLVRFEASAAEAVRLTKVVARSQTGSLADAVNYRLMADTNNDGVVDTVVRTGVTPVSGLLTFDAIAGGNGQSIGTTNAVTFAIVADIVAEPAGQHVQLQLATGDASYIAGRRETPAVALAGIRTDGVCAISVCQLSVITRPSILWTIQVEPPPPPPPPPSQTCGNGVLEGDEQCDDGNTVDTDECTNTCAYPALQGACLLSGLNAYWAFDEASGTRADAAQSFDLTEQYGTVPSGTGVLLSAAVGSGSSQNTFLLHRASSALTNANRDFTVAQWSYLPSDRNGSALTSYAMDNSAMFWNIGYATYGNPAQYFFGIGDMKAVSRTFGAPVLGEWNLVVGSYNATTKEISISVNGGPRDTTAFTGSSVLRGGTGSTLTMLNLLAGDRLDETGIWNRVLTQDEIADLYNNGNALSFADFADSCTPAVCGNGVLEGDEQCDDGNTDETDDCDNACNLTTPLPEF